MVKYGYANDVDKMIERLKYDILYYENMSLVLDITILIYTVRTVFTGKGIWNGKRRFILQVPVVEGQAYKRKAFYSVTELATMEVQVLWGLIRLLRCEIA